MLLFTTTPFDQSASSSPPLNVIVFTSRLITAVNRHSDRGEGEPVRRRPDFSEGTYKSGGQAR